MGLMEQLEQPIIIRAHSETIFRLGLNTYLPRKQREEAIDAILELIDITDMNQIIDMIEFLETPDEFNRLPSFSYVISRLLRTLI